MKWNARTAQQATDYAAFKTLMREEHCALEAVGALNVADTTLHANLLREIKEGQDNMVDNIKQDMHAHFMECLGYYASMEQEEEENERRDDDASYQANAARRATTTEEKMFQLFQNMEKRMDDLSKKLAEQNNNSKANMDIKKVFSKKR